MIRDASQIGYQPDRKTKGDMPLNSTAEIRRVTSAERGQ